MILESNVYVRRIEAVRRLMSSKGIDAVIISGSDPHASEYPASRWKQVEWVCGFTGEAGDVVITQDHAGLWTDTRYFIQAEQQLAGTGVALHKTRIPGEVRIPQWLADYAFADRWGSVALAVDGLSQPVSFINELENAFGCRQVRILDLPDMLDDLWMDRPAVPATPVITLGEDLTGESRLSKLGRLRSFIDGKNCDAILVTALDEIAWLLNVRGSDVEYNPVVLSYLLVTQDNAEWFVRKSKTVDDETYDSFDELMKDGVEIKCYDDICISLSEYACPGARLYADTATLNYHLYKVLKDVGDNFSMVEGASPVPLYKAVKNGTEIEGMREAHVEDGVAMEKFLWWLDCCMKDGIELSEWDAARYLGSLRAEIQGYRGDSFQTISAYGPSAALPHYVTPEGGGRMLEPHGLYLCDSGGQYLFGTTDITRTVPLGPCDGLEMEDYTLVLKGHIGLAMSVFPAGTAGCQIDYAARSPLWQARRNFGHGTGHGVGFFLNVHEGPQDIRQNLNPQPLVPGMITSDEPGLYREGLHGIRHESLLLCKDAGVNEFASWLCFEPLTLCHIDTSAVIADLLASDERDWLNAYNERVWQNLSPLLPEEVALWLRTKTLPI